jgi:CsoR family transcriptional regulator, copper-sensing transcriptional repressor
MMNPEQKQKVQARLSRIAGQVEGIRGMVEDDRYCVDVLVQLSAVQSALAKVGQLVLDAHVRTCVSQAMTSGDQGERDDKIAELMDIFGRYARIR